MKVFKRRIRPELTFRSNPLRKTSCPLTRERERERESKAALGSLWGVKLDGNFNVPIPRHIERNSEKWSIITVSHHSTSKATFPSPVHSSPQLRQSSLLSPLSCGTDTEQYCLASVAEHAGTASTLLLSAEEWK